MWDWMQHQMTWGSMGGMGIGMVLFWTLIIVLIVVFVRRLNGGGAELERKPPPTPLDILKERYARGEIDKGEFERKQRDLYG
jgi:putative membrane protein